MANELIRTLRDATREAHRKVDTHPVLQPLLGRQRDVRGYARALLALYRPQMLLETAASQGLQQQGWRYALHPRGPSLARDLAALGLARPGLDAEPAPDAGSPARLVGLLYVMEGSRLGARVIFGTLAAVLDEDVPVEYFREAANGRPWPEFMTFAQDACPIRHAGLAVAAACDAFALYLKWLDHAAAGGATSR